MMMLWWCWCFTIIIIIMIIIIIILITRVVVATSTTIPHHRRQDLPGGRSVATTGGIFSSRPDDSFPIINIYFFVRSIFVLLQSPFLLSTLSFLSEVRQPATVLFDSWLVRVKTRRVRSKRETEAIVISYWY